MKSKRLFLFLSFLAATALLSGHSQVASQIKSPAAPPVSKSATANQTAQSHEGDGERIFQQNCARCHNPPDGFSSRISGTVLRHMRVRASLSKHDEEELLRFFNP